mmetsp:Transcript_96896/g.167065  ORF Transcript_96896/g.167065 Transcript_96896/m.167065 type:complete len:86 (-) Transcript_96896:87-344(-)
MLLKDSLLGWPPRVVQIVSPLSLRGPRKTHSKLGHDRQIELEDRLADVLREPKKGCSDAEHYDVDCLWVLWRSGFSGLSVAYFLG